MSVYVSIKYLYSLVFCDYQFAIVKCVKAPMYHASLAHSLTRTVTGPVKNISIGLIAFDYIA
jgi:hypothetical protein